MATKKNDEAPVEAVEPQEEATPEVPEEPAAGVFVAKVYTERGIQTQVLLQGKIEATEVQTLLELAINGWREQIGLKAR